MYSEETEIERVYVHELFALPAIHLRTGFYAKWRHPIDERDALIHAVPGS
jgi:hypothetical protein